MSRLLALFLLPLAAVTDLAVAADGASRPLNWNAIGMFLVFVLFTLGVTRWATLRTRSTSDLPPRGITISIAPCARSKAPAAGDSC